MFGIGQFFQKIHNSFTREVLQRSIVSEVIKKHTGAQIPIESISSTGPYPLLKADVYINSRFVLSSNSPTNISFIPKDVTTSSGPSTVRIVVFDQVKNKAEVSLSINLK